MSKCSIKKGFFLLQTCKAPTTQQCTQCQRFACAQHMSANHVCTMCSSITAELETELNEYDTAWVHRKRRNHYTTSGATPLVLDESGASGYEYFDDSDAAHFYHQNSDYDPLDEDSTDFFDS